MRRLEALEAIESLSEHMLQDPAVVAGFDLPQFVRRLHRYTRNDDPRYAQLPEDSNETGTLIYSYIFTAAIPDALRALIDSPQQETNVRFFATDYRAPTVRRLVERARAWTEAPAAQVPGLEFQLAGGIVGVTAAINEEIRTSSWRIVPAVLGFVFFSVLIFYRSFHAAWLMLMTMLLATVLTHAYMRFAGISMNLNTVSVVGVGIGIGIDYAIYLMDRIRREMGDGASSIGEAVRRAIATTGLAITFTAATLVCGVAAWVVGSTLRFQADAAQLLIAMMIFNMLAALLFVPAWITVAKPRFVQTLTPQQESR
ncbi:MAG: MMPL family transporter [Myxococcales bacterium]|nr:MMPL family transporter [Myxococcales bacterium]